LNSLFDSSPDIRMIAPQATVPGAAGAPPTRSSGVHKIIEISILH
jgi:hypothetical protein